MRFFLMLTALAVAAGAAETGTVTGTVEHADTGEPVQNVRVELLQVSLDRLAPLSESICAVTDKRGRFKLKNVPPGKWFVGVRDSLMAPACEDVAAVVKPGKKVKKLKLTASEGGSIEGGVYKDLDFSEGVPGLVVQCVSGNKRRQAFTGVTDSAGQYRVGGLNDGWYYVGLAPGQAYFKFSPIFVADNAPPMDDSIMVEGKTPVKDVEFQVSKGFAVSGAVVDTEGNPAAGAEVGHLSWSLYDPEEFTPLTTTDEQGRFIIKMLEKPKGELSARQGELLSRNTEYKAAAGPAAGEPCTLRLVKPGRVRGRVVNQAGEPMKRVSVNFSSSGGGETDADGRFATGNMFAGSYEITLMYRPDKSHGFNHVEAGTIEVGEGQIIEDYQIVVEEARPEPEKTEVLTVSGRVTSPEGQPVAGAEVGAYLRSNTPIALAKTDANGAYTIATPLAAGQEEQNKLLLAVKAEGFNYGFLKEVVPGSTGNDLALEWAPLLALRVVGDASGEAAARYKVEARDMGGGREHGLYLTQVVQRKVENEKGELQLRLPASVWQIKIRAEDGYLPVEREVSTQDRYEEFCLEIRLPRPARLEGTVRKPDGTPLPGAKLVVLPWVRVNPGRPPRAVTGADGRFAIKALTPGLPVLRVSHSDYSDKLVNLDIRDGQTSFVDLALEEHGAISGRVTLGGQPVRASVRRWDSGDWQSAQTDDKGRYSFENVDAGDVMVLVELSARDMDERNVYRQARVEAGQMATADFTIAPPTSGLKGTLRVDGQPAHGHIWIHFRYPSAESEKVLRTNLSDGTYSLINLPPGPAIVQFRSQKRAVYREVVFPENGTLELDGEITDGVSVSGVIKGVHDPDVSYVYILGGRVTRQDLAEAPVYSLDARNIGGHRGAGGTFTIDNICPGAYTAVLWRKTETPLVTAGLVIDIKSFEVGAEPVTGIELHTPP